MTFSTNNKTIERFNTNYLSQVEYFLQKYLVVNVDLLERHTRLRLLRARARESNTITSHTPFHWVFSCFSGKIFPSSSQKNNSILTEFSLSCSGGNPSAVADTLPRIVGNPSAVADTLPRIVGNPSAVADTLPRIVGNPSAVADTLPRIVGNPSAVADTLPRIVGNPSAVADTLPRIVGSPSAVADTLPRIVGNPSAVADTLPRIVGSPSAIADSLLEFVNNSKTDKNIRIINFLK